MSIKNYLRNRTVKFLGLPMGTSVDGIVTRNYGKAPKFDPERQVSGITYKAIDKIGQSLSVYEMFVKKPNGDPYENHPLLNLFNNPNPKQNASDFTHLYGMLFEIFGETFWYLARGENTKKVKEVYLLDPSKIEVKTSGGELIGYVLHKSTGENVPFLPEEIVHDKRPNPFNEWRGMSVIERAASYIDIEIDTTNFTLNYIRNNASPSGIVSLPNMSRETFNQFAAQWREGYEGPQNAGKTAFIRSGEASFHAVGATLKDIDMKELRSMTQDDVLMMLDVPKPLIGLTDESGFGRGNVETLNYIFASQKLEPMMRRLDRIWEHIAKENSGGQFVDVEHTSPVPEDKEHKLARLKEGTNVWMTINDARALDGLDPLPGGDVIIGRNPLAPPIGEKALEGAKIKVVKKAMPSQAQIAKAEQEKNENFRAELMATNDLYTKRAKTVISDFANEQQKTVIARMNASSKSFEEWLFNIKEESEALAALLLPVMYALMEAQAEGTVNFITGEVWQLTAEMKRTMEARIKQIAGVYNQETITALEKTLAEGTASGESLPKLKKRVESKFKDAKGYRAERIARTESLKASNMTAEQVYKQNGYSRIKWFINPGACEFCRAMANQSKEIGSKYLNIGDKITGVDGGQLQITYDDIQTPPLHPNCACSIIPEK